MKIRTLMTIHAMLEANLSVATIATATGISATEIGHIRDERERDAREDADAHRDDMAATHRSHELERAASARAAL
jgi:hypothetical protein